MTKYIATIKSVDQLDFWGLTLRDRHGRKEAVCDCGAWCVLDYYMGDEIVIRQLQHTPPCATYESFVAFARNK